jgi:hypothetical protein
MKPRHKQPLITLLAWFLSASAVCADDSTPIQVNWDSRTASCPATVTKSTNLTFRVSNINDLLIDFRTGETVEYQFRAKGWPVSVAPPENPFLPQIGGGVCPDDATVTAQLNAIRNIQDEHITPTTTAGASLSLSATSNAARSHGQVRAVEAEYSNTTCASGVFAAHADDPVMQWIKKLETPAPHYVDFNVAVTSNENYQFTVKQLWKGKVVSDGTLTWECGENDIVTLSAGPLITTLPYRTYNQQQVPVAGGGTQNQLVVSGNSNVNVLGAALLNYHLPPIPHLPPWTGFALSAGPVYTLNSAPSVSKLGLFVGGSFQLYRSIFLTSGIHIGEFADYPAGFHPGSTIPPNFGNLTPVTRNTAHFAVGITFKTATFKKSSQNNAGAANGGATANAGGGSGSKPKAPQPTSGSQGSGANAPQQQQPQQQPPNQ